ncbi:DEHA2B14586p [Debaryomyces hansenii CBS767]|uniref:DEHA2B14586p n=1 Tax=Debaryomyces hansenii (strain ATCC 36239 / CBS 767 / BCRC 21394 / JCM 1990 / NBRC 0083 / IGC 2968) TaxID=284592 RepID=Q6BW38_DEBHA|nr:DEHA2B14586p [Debaryomyces hansenii CBS767]CAG85592.2 DEHA2B14586p [Debaryomyces hansenii CBS767]|eukprot:XP_457581.2 DEHA2B14586p [Debaryomyces hansenii CBS767]
MIISDDTTEADEAEEEKSSSDNNENSIDTKYSHKYEITNHNEGINLHNVDEIEEGTLSYTDNDIETEIPKKGNSNKDREFPWDCFMSDTSLAFLFLGLLSVNHQLKLLKLLP